MSKGMQYYQYMMSPANIFDIIKTRFDVSNKIDNQLITKLSVCN